MEIRITTNQLLRIIYIISWIIFIGLCIEAGGTVVNTIITLFITPLGVENFWEGADYLANLYNFDKGHFIVITIIMNIVAILKAILFYQIIKLLADKKLNIFKPFSVELKDFILKVSYLSLGIGLISHFGLKYSTWLITQGLQEANLKLLHIAGADVWIFMSVILFIIVQIFKRGIELQTDDELTI